MAVIKYKNGSSWNNLMLDSMYPIGSVYMSYNSTSPASIFGGEWTQLTTGVLRAANDNGTGGSDTISHSHLYGLAFYCYYGVVVGADTNAIRLYNGLTKSYISSGDTDKAATTNANNNITTAAKSVSSVACHGGTTNTTEQSLSNLPEYQNIYTWRRTA